jgi:lipoprotein-releasing system ATP-binding protein
MSSLDQNKPADAGAILQCANVSKSFEMASGRIHVLNGVNLSVAAHSSVAIMGSSGGGKSTLLHILGGLEPASSGEVFIAGQCLQQLKRTELAQVRNQHLGFVYQFHHLLGDLSALENVIMPLLIAGMPKKQASAIGMDWLARVGLAKHAAKKPGYLSGGERQRIAIARALVHTPKCVLADEPTANLDRANAGVVLALLLELCRDSGCSLVLVTHDAQIASALQRTVRLVEGKLQGA